MTWFVISLSEISVGFQDTQFTLEEDSGSVDVIFGKLNGVMSEVPIVVMVAFSNPLDGIIQGLLTSNQHNR